jgi:hypothetical protein
MGNCQPCAAPHHLLSLGAFNCLIGHQPTLNAGAFFPLLSSSVSSGEKSLETTKSELGESICFRAKIGLKVRRKKSPTNEVVVSSEVQTLHTSGPSALHLSLARGSLCVFPGFITRPELDAFN